MSSHRIFPEVMNTISTVGHPHAFDALNVQPELNINPDGSHWSRKGLYGIQDIVIQDWALHGFSSSLAAKVRKGTLLSPKDVENLKISELRTPKTERWDATLDDATLFFLEEYMKLPQNLQAPQQLKEKDITHTLIKDTKKWLSETTSRVFFATLIPENEQAQKYSHLSMMAYTFDVIGVKKVIGALVETYLGFKGSFNNNIQCLVAAFSSYLGDLQRDLFQKKLLTFGTSSLFPSIAPNYTDLGDPDRKIAAHIGAMGKFFRSIWLTLCYSTLPTYIKKGTLKAMDKEIIEASKNGLQDADTNFRALYNSTNLSEKMMSSVITAGQRNMLQKFKHGAIVMFTYATAVVGVMFGSAGFSFGESIDSNAFIFGYGAAKQIEKVPGLFNRGARKLWEYGNKATALMKRTLSYIKLMKKAQVPPPTACCIQGDCNDCRLAKAKHLFKMKEAEKPEDSLKMFTFKMAVGGLAVIAIAAGAFGNAVIIAPSMKLMSFIYYLPENTKAVIKKGISGISSGIKSAFRNVRDAAGSLRGRFTKFWNRRKKMPSNQAVLTSR